MVDGEALIKHSLRERRQRIASALPKLRAGYIQVAQSLELHVPLAEEKEAVVKVVSQLAVIGSFAMSSAMPFFLDLEYQKSTSMVAKVYSSGG